MWTGGKGFNLYAIDVSQAFMNSPLTVKVCVRLPSSISTLDNEPVFLEAYKGLNGLRIASLTWVLFFDGIVKSVGIRSGLVEPCLYGGMVRGAPILVICYVDDLLVATPSEAAYRVLFEALEKQVKIRETGRVTMSGGSLKFLGPYHPQREGKLRFAVVCRPGLPEQCVRGVWNLQRFHCIS